MNKILRNWFELNKGCSQRTTQRATQRAKCVDKGQHKGQSVLTKGKTCWQRATQRAVCVDKGQKANRTEGRRNGGEKKTADTRQTKAWRMLRKGKTSVKYIDKFSSVQFSPLINLVAGGHEGRFSGDPGTVFFCRRSSWADLACAGMSTLWCCPSSISSADYGVAYAASALKDGFGEAVVVCDMLEPCEYVDKEW